MAKQKYYVVWRGIQPGIYTSWAECETQVKGFTGARFKSFPSLEEAEEAYSEKPPAYYSNNRGKTNNVQSTQSFDDEINFNSVSVDVGTRGNPGPVEYKGVDTRTGEVVFSHGPISKGTNNIGEFLAIVHALAWLHQQGSDRAIYTDSVNAMKWVKNKQVSTTLERDASTEEIWDLIERAEHWLKTHTYSNEILKWNTKRWGEIKADYGRK